MKGQDPLYRLYPLHVLIRGVVEGSMRSPSNSHFFDTPICQTTRSHKGKFNEKHIYHLPQHSILGRPPSLSRTDILDVEARLGERISTSSRKPRPTISAHIRCIQPAKLRSRTHSRRPNRSYTFLLSLRSLKRKLPRSGIHPKHDHSRRNSGTESCRH